MQVYQQQRLNFLVVYSACEEKCLKSDYDGTPRNGVMRGKSFRYWLRGFPRAVLLSLTAIQSASGRVGLRGLRRGRSTNNRIRPAKGVTVSV